MSKDVRLPLSRYRAAAARYVLDNADSTTLVEAADALLDAGIYSWSVGELATTPDSTTRDVGRLFEMSLKELAIPLPSPEEAVCTLVRWHLGGAIEGRDTAFQALERVRDEVSYPLRFDRRLSNLEPQLRFINLWFSYDDLHDHAEAGIISHEEAELRATELDSEILDHARSWMFLNGPSLLDPRWLSWSDGVVRKLAQAIVDESAWDRLPILADALEEAGCSNSEILEHCRAGELHVGCCWITEVLLHQEAARSP
jgi:hypothetical protein